MNFQITTDEYGFHKVIYNTIEVGTLRNFCCGVDFRPTGYSCLFSILNIKRDDPKALDCVAEILQLDLGRLKGHYNYQHPDNRKQTFDEIRTGFERYYEH